MVTSGILKASILSYTPRDINNITPDDIDVILPTIQNITINTSSSVNMHPTVTGGTLAQYSKSKPMTVVINILLQTGEIAYTYSGEEIITRNILEHIDTIDENKLIFDLVTTDMNLKHYLRNLVIQSKSFTKSADRKDAIICSLTCTEVRFTDIKWELVDKAEVLGVNIGEDLDIRNISATMIRRNDAAIKFAFYKYHVLYSEFAYGLLGQNNTPGKLTGQYLYDNNLPEEPTYYLELDGIVIDLTNGPAKYIIDTKFSLSENVNSEDEIATVYNANFGNIIVEINAENDSVALTNQGVVNTLFTSITQNTLSLLRTMKLESAYNVLNQYSQLDVAETFDKFINRKKIAETISRRMEDENFIRYLNDIEIGKLPKNKKVVLLKHFDSTGILSAKHLLAKDITSLYSYKIIMGDKDTGGIQTPITGAASACNIQHREFSQFYATRGQTEFYSTEDASYNEYYSQLISVCIGTKLYLFIISTDILTVLNVPGDTTV